MDYKYVVIGTSFPELFKEVEDAAIWAHKNSGSVYVIGNECEYELEVKIREKGKGKDIIESSL